MEKSAPLYCYTYTDWNHFTFVICVPLLLSFTYFRENLWENKFFLELFAEQIFLRKFWQKQKHFRKIFQQSHVIKKGRPYIYMETRGKLG